MRRILNKIGTGLGRMTQPKAVAEVILTPAPAVVDAAAATRNALVEQAGPAFGDPEVGKTLEDSERKKFEAEFQGRRDGFEKTLAATTNASDALEKQRHLEELVQSIKGAIARYKKVLVTARCITQAVPIENSNERQVFLIRTLHQKGQAGKVIRIPLHRIVPIPGASHTFETITPPSSNWQSEFFPSEKELEPKIQGLKHLLVVVEAELKGIAPLVAAKEKRKQRNDQWQEENRKEIGDLVDGEVTIPVSVGPDVEAREKWVAARVRYLLRKHEELQKGEYSNTSGTVMTNEVVVQKPE